VRPCLHPLVKRQCTNPGQISNSAARPAICQQMFAGDIFYFDLVARMSAASARRGGWHATQLVLGGSEKDSPLALSAPDKGPEAFAPFASSRDHPSDALGRGGRSVGGNSMRS
jgi:hypothetical protein